MSNPKRLAMLEKLTGGGQADSFSWYALALEYSAAQRVDDALKAFQTLRVNDANYLPMYLMAGTMLTQAGRKDEAREWLESGIVMARAKGENHTMSELEDALNLIPPPPSIA